MQHISLTESQDLVPLRCPSCGRLVCERVGRLNAERSVRCSNCQNVTSLEALIASDPALGRVLSAQNEIRVMRRAV